MKIIMLAGNELFLVKTILRSQFWKKMKTLPLIENPNF